MPVTLLHRYVFPPSQVPLAGTASSSDPTRSEVLLRENLRLQKELEVYVEKAARLQKVSKGSGGMVRARRTVPAGGS